MSEQAKRYGFKMPSKVYNVAHIVTRNRHEIPLALCSETIELGRTFDAGNPPFVTIKYCQRCERKFGSA